MYIRIGSRIKKAREEKRLSQAELGARLGLTATAVNYYEKGKRKISIDDLFRLAATLDKPVDYFLSEWNVETDGRGKRPPGREPGILCDLTGIPVLGTVRAGEPVPTEQQVMGFLPFPCKPGGEMYFALRVQGDSMVEEGICEGDLVLIRRQSDVDFNGQIICALINGEENTLKVFFKEKEGEIRLRAANKAYPDIVLNNEGDLTIQGVYAGVFKLPSTPKTNGSASIRELHPE